MALINNKDLRLVTVNTLKANSNVTALVGATRIYDSKVTPHMFGNLPAIGCYITSSAATGVDHVTPGFVKTVDINIEVAVAGNSATFMNITDDTIFAIKNALFGNSAWQGQFESVAGYSEEISLDDAGEQPVSLSTLTINCEIVEST